MNKLSGSVLWILLLISFLSAKPITLDEAQLVAQNWMLERTGSSAGSLAVHETFSITANSTIIYYVFNFAPSGFVIISGDDIVYPVIGYSYEEIYQENNQPPAFVDWMENVKMEITKAFEENLTANSRTTEEWRRLKIEKYDFHLKKKNIISQKARLTSTNWGQDWPYNQDCPPAPLPAPEKLVGYKGKCPTGCVATAMAQIMNFYKYPRRGRSASEYIDNVNGDFWQDTLKVDFASTNYRWPLPNEISKKSSVQDINDVAKLMLHCGISVKMNYEPAGSEAFTSDARNSYVKYFDYSIEAAYIERGVMNTSTQWIDLLRDELENNRVVHYRGQGTGGHSFIIDGFEGEAFFRINWGWSGLFNNSYYYLDALTPDAANFTLKQAAVLNIKPTHNSQIIDLTPVMFVFQRKWEPPAKGGKTDPIYVINSNPLSNSRINYIISPTESWLKTNVNKGTTSDYFIITAEENKTSDRRTSKVKIIATSGGVFSASSTQIISVSQPSSGEINAVDVALIIDCSPSMVDKNYLTPAKIAASTFVDFMQDNDNLAVVSFADYAIVNYGLTKITSESIKNAAKQAINRIYSFSATCIGAGVQSGQIELNKGRTSAHQALILLSDGEENTYPYWDDVKSSIPENTDIYTIALGGESDMNLLSRIAAETGGDFLYAPEASQLQAIYNYLRGSITNYKTFSTHSGEISQGTTLSFSTPIDALTKEIQFSVTFLNGNIDMELVNPNGKLINGAIAAMDTTIKFSKGSNYCLYQINSPVPGEWQQKIIGKQITLATTFNASVQGLSEIKEEPFLYNSEYEQGQAITVSTILSMFEKPLLGSFVYALVEKPGMNYSHIRSDEKNPMGVNIEAQKMVFEVDSLVLYDDGLHSDGAKNDGLYSNILTDTENDGNYTFTITAMGSVAGAGEFQRESSFSTVVNSSDRPNVPRLVSVTNGSKDVSLNPTLQWEPSIKASSYQLLLSYLYRSSNSTNSIIVLDTLIQQEAFSTKELELGRTFNWRVRALAENGLASDWSPEWSFTTLYPSDMENICFPNPFNPERDIITIRFRLQESSDVCIKIYDSSSFLVKTIESHFDKGVNDIEWNGKNDSGSIVANGVYFYVIDSSDGEDKIGKIAVLR